MIGVEPCRSNQRVLSVPAAILRAMTISNARSPFWIGGSVSRSGHSSEASSVSP